MAIESLCLLVIVIVAAQISLVLITIIVAGKYIWLFNLNVEFIDHKDHKIEFGFSFHFTVNLPSADDGSLRNPVQ